MEKNTFLVLLVLDKTVTLCIVEESNRSFSHFILRFNNFIFVGTQLDIFEVYNFSFVWIGRSRRQLTIFIDVGKHFFETWDEFWNGMDWDYWESRQDSLCQNCLMHSGFEASAVLELKKSPRDLLRMAAWNLLG